MKAIPLIPGRSYRVIEYATNRWMDIIAKNGSEAIARFTAALYNI